MAADRKRSSSKGSRPEINPSMPFDLDPAEAADGGSAATPESTIALLSRIAASLERGATLSECLSAAVAEATRFAGWPAGACLIRERPAVDEWVSQAWVGDEAVRGAIEAPLLEALAGGSAVEGPLGQILRGEASFAEGEVERLLPETCRKPAAKLGLVQVHAFPVRAEGATSAIVALFSTDDAPSDAEARRALDLLRTLLDQVAGRHRAHAAVSGAARHVRSLTEKVEPTATRLRELEERYALLCRGSAHGLWDWDLTQDKIHFSARWKSILGYSAQELSDQPSEWFDRVHGDDKDRVELELLEHLDWQSPRFESEHRIMHRDGTFRCVQVRGVALHDDDGKAYRIAGSMSDITSVLERDEHAVKGMLYHRLTGLPTNALLVDRIEQAMRRRLRRPDRSFTVVALGLDGLVEAAERIGSEATEELQLAIGRRVANVIRPGDTLAHRDGLEFGILLDDVKNLQDARTVAERVAKALSQPIPLGDEEIALGPVMGLALSRSSYESPEEMLRDASIALRRARREEVDCQVFDAATKAYAQSIAELEGDLRQAFEDRALFLEYQPVVSLSDGRITGVEAFLRWTHPERGPIPPSEFLPVAEEAGLLEEMGYWVIEQACSQMKAWVDRFSLRFPPNLAINLTESQLFDESLVARAVEGIESAGLDPKLVRFDISESTFMKDGPAAGRILKALTKRGIRVAVDDFGTGYSSLSYLHRYPIGALKIDRVFVSGAAGAGHEWDVARTVIELAKILELEVIAEGIETREQFLHLRSLGCQQAQGYYFSGPVSATKAGKLIREGYPLDMQSIEV